MRFKEANTQWVPDLWVPDSLGTMDLWVRLLFGYQFWVRYLWVRLLFGYGYSLGTKFGYSFFGYDGSLELPQAELSRIRTALNQNCPDSELFVSELSRIRTVRIRTAPNQNYSIRMLMA
uniref:Uncharacterized protein n=1 Tax=Caenorhabditis japonica TaxID=281687 RepID=A0A8R1E544_CAEJA